MNENERGWKFNFQLEEDEKKELPSEEFEVVLIGKNFLILKNKEGNNSRVKYSFPNLYTIGEKIYKENGIFLWAKE
jgi:hypothetical protein